MAANNSKTMISQHPRKGHTRPRQPTISLDQPGRLRIAHVIALFGISHSSLYMGMRKGRYPKPDGYDGSIPYFNTETIRNYLAKSSGGSRNG